MSSRHRIAGLLCGVLVCGLPAAASTHHPAKKPLATKPVQQVPAQPVVSEAPPPPPPTPEQSPATPPHVTMSSGQLSIVAENSTLGDVLSAVKSLTGAGLEAPGSASAERVAVHLGPGSPQEVLQQLLAGSKFNYIILGSPDNSAAIQKIILISKAGGSAAPGAANNVAGNQPGGPPRGYQPPQTPDYQADSGNVEEEIVQPEPPQPQEDVAFPGPGGQQGQIGPNGQAMPTDPNQQQGPKTPEQLLQELQRMQQQQQQQQQGQPGRPERGPTPQ